MRYDPKITFETLFISGIILIFIIKVTTIRVKTFDLEEKPASHDCEFDYVEIKGEKYCGSEIPKKIELKLDLLSVLFTTFVVVIISGSAVNTLVRYT